MSHWQFRGPTGKQFTGRINTVAPHPTHSGTLYVGAASGGVWKTTDGGNKWKPLSNDWTFQPVASIAIDPQAPETIYVGTGDFDGWTRQTFGLMKSTDGGATFGAPLAVNEVGQRSVSSIVVDPEQPSIVTVTTGRGATNLGQVWRSTDGGSSWNAVVTELAEWKQLAISLPDQEGVRSYYACGKRANGTPALYRSDTRGATWIELTDIHSITSVAPSTATAKGVYGMGPDKTVRFSASGGDAGTWNDISGNLTQVAVDWGQFWYDSFLRCIAIDGSDRVILGLKHFFQWDGNSWSAVSTELHEDQHDLRADPTNPNRVVFGNDGGVWTITWDPIAKQWSTWASLNPGIGATQIYKAGFSRQDPSVMLCGTQDNSAFSAQGGKWSYVTIPISGDAYGAAMSPTNDKVQFLAAGPPGEFHGLHRTDDRWQSQKDITPQSYDETLLAMDSAGTTLYLANDFLFAWSEATQSWGSQLGGQQLVETVGAHSQSAIAVAPADGQRVYTGSDDGQLWMGVGPGWTWMRIDPGTPPLPGGGITAISVNPLNSNDVLVAVSVAGPHKLWRCTDVNAAPRVWADVSGIATAPLPDERIWAIVDVGVWYLGTDVGVFESADHGGTWSDITRVLGLPRVPVRDLAMSGSTLFAATWGRGIWSLDLAVHIASQLERTTHLLLFLETLARKLIQLHPQPDDKRAAQVIEHEALAARRALSAVIEAVGKLTRHH
jgi:hypothetical protein